MVWCGGGGGDGSEKCSVKPQHIDYSLVLQVEMFLLGHTLGVTLQVVRPGSYGQDDFICYYPDVNIGLWPEVTLVAEDDRHYNVLVK